MLFEACQDARWTRVWLFRTAAICLRDAIDSTRNWPGILGRYDFVKSPQRGLDNNWVIIERWDPDKDAFVAMSKPGGAVR